MFALNFPLLNFIPLILLITPQATLNNIPSTRRLTSPPVLVGSRRRGDAKLCLLGLAHGPKHKTKARNVLSNSLRHDATPRIGREGVLQTATGGDSEGRCF